MAYQVRHSGFSGAAPTWSLEALMKSAITRRQRAVRDSSKFNVQENLRRARLSDLRREREAVKGTTGVGLTFSASGAPLFRARTPQAPGEGLPAAKTKLKTPKGINYERR